MTGHERGVSVRWLTAAAWASLIVFAATSTVVATALPKIGAELDLSLALQGLLSPIRSTLLGVFAFIVGYAADRTGKKWLLSIAMFVIALALLCHLAAGTYAGLVAVTLVLGAGLGGQEALASPLVADLHPNDVELHLPLLHAFFPLGIVIFSVLSGLALDAGVPWRVLFASASIPAALVGVMFLLGHYGEEHHQAARRRVLSVPVLLANPAFWLLGAAMALTAGAEGVLLLWTPSFVQREYGSSALVAASGLTCFSAAMAFGRFAGGFVARRVPIHKLLVGLSVAGIVVTTALVLFRSVVASFTAFGLSGLLIACFWPGILSIATRRIAAGSAVLLAMLSGTGIVGYGAMPWIVGVVADHVGLRHALWGLPLAMAAATVALLAVGRRQERPGGISDDYTSLVAPE